MKILISYLFCTKGGVETALINRLKEINTEMYQVDLHFFQECGGISMFEDWNGQIFIERSADNIKKQIIQNEYDAVIAIDSKNMLDILMEMDYKGKIGLEVHTTYEEGLRYLKDKVIDIVDFVIVPSQYQKELVSSKIEDKEIYVLGNAVSGNLKYIPNKKLPYDKKIILWVGRIDNHKNWRLFLKIASELIKYDDNLCFWLVGGLKSLPEEINEFEEKLYELNLECRVRWIPQVQYKQMSDIYSYVSNSGGCYMSTSMNESFGMTIIEAMICRCPVIVNAVGALTELVQDGRGLCLRDMDVPENIERIWKFISNPNRQNIINKSQNYVIENFSCKSISRRFEQIMEEILSDKRYKKH